MSLRHVVKVKLQIARQPRSSGIINFQPYTDNVDVSLRVKAFRAEQKTKQTLINIIVRIEYKIITQTLNTVQKCINIYKVTGKIFYISFYIQFHLSLFQDILSINGCKITKLLQKDEHQRLDVPSGSSAEIENHREANSNTCQFRFFLYENRGDIEKDRPRIHFLAGNGLIKLYHNFHRLYQVEIIHYELEGGLKFPDIFINKTRVVKSEVKTLNLENDEHTVYKKTFAEVYRNQPEEIVRKAVEKIGERKWKFFGRWSSDFVNECVLVDDNTYYSRGEKFARLLHASFSNRLYHDTMALGTCSIFGFFHYVLKQKPEDVNLQLARISQ